MDQAPDAYEDEVGEPDSGSAGTTRFYVAWAVLGALAACASVAVSLIVCMAFEQPTHCDYRDWCPASVVLSKGAPALCCLWGSWILSGAILWLIGWRATPRSRTATLVLALLSGAAVYPIGVILTGFVLVQAIDSTHGY